MSLETNKVIVRRYNKLWQTGEVQIADEIIRPGYVDHSHPEWPVGLEGGLDARRGRLLSRPYYSNCHASDQNHDSLHSGQPQPGAGEIRAVAPITAPVSRHRSERQLPLLCQPALDPCRNGITDLAEDGQPFFLGAGGRTGVGEASMLLPLGTREIRTLLCRFITDRHDQVHWRLFDEFLQAFGAMPCRLTDVNANLRHCPDSQGMDAARMGAGAENLIALSATRLQETLGHLRAR